jgi:hypothetical protein
MADTVTLIIPAGTLGYAISHGSREFPVYAHPDCSGRCVVDVPAAIAPYFLHNGGYQVMTKEVPAFSGGIGRIVHPDGPRSFGWDGHPLQP